MTTVFDLHVHTVKGSSDSSLSPEDLVSEALRLGLDGVCLTEHSGWRDLEEFKAFAARQELIVVHALEVDTVYGHVLAFGVDAYGSGFSNVRELRRAVHRVGGYLVTAHVFRNIFNPPPYNRSIVFADPDAYPKTTAEALTHPVFHMVDDVEVFNGANTERENGFALEVARNLGERAPAAATRTPPRASARASPSSTATFARRQTCWRRCGQAPTVPSTGSPSASSPLSMKNPWRSRRPSPTSPQAGGAPAAPSPPS